MVTTVTLPIIQADQASSSLIGPCMFLLKLSCSPSKKKMAFSNREDHSSFKGLQVAELFCQILQTLKVYKSSRYVENQCRDCPNRSINCKTMPQLI